MIWDRVRVRYRVWDRLWDRVRVGVHTAQKRNGDRLPGPSFGPGGTCHASPLEGWGSDLVGWKE